MPIPNSHPIRFTPRGLVDAFDATDKFPGACRNLVNLIFDSSNPELVISRPGVTTAANLVALGIVGATFISVQVSIGTRTYGMVASNLNLGFDQPFCYDHAAGALVAIGGIAAGNVPTSPATTGAWTPPTMAQIGSLIIVTHPGFSGVGTNFFGVIDITNPAAPVWSSSNLGVNPLPVVPVAVANFNNRAWYAFRNVGAAKLAYSDNLAAITRTNASQQLVVGGDDPIVALSGLPLQTTSSGVVSALVALKGSQVWQVTGDTTTSDLALNFISLTVGTQFPRSVTNSPAGIYFLSTNGPWFIDPFGGLRPLTNSAQNLDPDVQTPFINAPTPTRWAAAYAVGIYRACGDTSLGGVTQTNDYWFDEKRRRWNGPHSFPYDCASILGSAFILSSAAQPGRLMRSSATQEPTSLYTDLGALYGVALASSTFPKVGDMCTKQVAESQIELGNGNTYNVTVTDDEGNAIGYPTSTVSITTQSVTLPLWGSVVWGSFTWSATQRLRPRTYAVPWPSPLNFEKMRLSVAAIASSTLQIGTFYALYQKTGYMTLGPTIPS